VWSKNLRGDLQMHTRWSDGSGTIAEMADAAKELSYEHIAITDHSKGLKIGGGINEDALWKQRSAIAKINSSLLKAGAKLTVLHSIEMNLNARREGDMSPKSLLPLDLVLGSFHSSLRALEIDCYPDRQDLNVGLLKVAREHGTRISMGTDAHHPWQLEFIKLGLAAALKTKISSHQIINFMSISDLRNWVKQTRQRS